jgi:CubicO group peptidase (beta-lactamase class C family)
MNVQVLGGARDFGALHEAMRKYVERDIVAGISTAVLVGDELADMHCVGWADKEAGVALRSDHIFRIFSNTKLITSCAVLLLWESGHFGLDDAIDRFIPQLAQRRVLRPGATRLDDTVPAASPITIRHLLSHSAGLAYGLFDKGTLMFDAYHRHKVRNPHTTLEQMMDTLADLPLLFHPGTSWEYSVATDVLSRLVEVISGQRFDAFIRTRILEPLGMADTGFVIPQSQQNRLVTMYAGANSAYPMKGGLTRLDDAPYPGAYLSEFPRLSGGGGLVSTLPDMVSLLRSFMPGGRALLRPDTLVLLMRNQLAPGVCLQLPGLGALPDKVFGLAGAMTVAPSAGGLQSAVGELQWGGIAGTHWWINPVANLAGVLMTQREMSFWHPFSLDFKRHAYQAVGLD